MSKSSFEVTIVFCEGHPLSAARFLREHATLIHAQLFQYPSIKGFLKLWVARSQGLALCFFATSLMKVYAPDARFKRSQSLSSYFMPPYPKPTTQDSKLPTLQPRCTFQEVAGQHNHNALSGGSDLSSSDSRKEWVEFGQCGLCRASEAPKQEVCTKYLVIEKVSTRGYCKACKKGFDKAY